MKFARQKKLEVQLEVVERELLTLLRDSLAHTAMHGDLLFFNSQHLPDNVPPHWASPSGEVLMALASQAVAIREQSGMPLHGTPGQLYIAACGEAADISNDHRRGPRQLAAWILGELGPN